MPDSYSASFISPDHRPHTGRSPFYKIFLGLPTLLASNLRCFERASPLATIVFKSFVVTPNRSLFHMFGHCENIFEKFLFMLAKVEEKPKGPRFEFLWYCGSFLIFLKQPTCPLSNSSGNKAFYKQRGLLNK